MSRRRLNTAGRRVRRGFGLLEFLLALALFATAAAGLLAAQATGLRTQFEAHQRGLAGALAADLLERIRANADSAAAYPATGVGDPARRVAEPAVACDSAACTPAELAAFDLWQWQEALLGSRATLGGAATGGLVAPRGCVEVAGGQVTVSLSWRGASAARASAESDCGAGEAGLYDAPEGAPGNNRLRRQLTLRAYLGTPP